MIQEELVQVRLDMCQAHVPVLDNSRRNRFLWLPMCKFSIFLKFLVISMHIFQGVYLCRFLPEIRPYLCDFYVNFVAKINCRSGRKFPNKACISKDNKRLLKQLPNDLVIYTLWPSDLAKMNWKAHTRQGTLYERVFPPSIETTGVSKRASKIFPRTMGK